MEQISPHPRLWRDFRLNPLPSRERKKTLSSLGDRAGVRGTRHLGIITFVLPSRFEMQRPNFDTSIITVKRTSKYEGLKG
jgi:hypothetical protein